MSKHASLNVLSKLTPGNQAFGWMAAYRDGPAFIAAPVQRGESFSRRIHQLIEERGAPEEAVQGILERREIGGLVFIK